MSSTLGIFLVMLIMCVTVTYSSKQSQSQLLRGTIELMESPTGVEEAATGLEDDADETYVFQLFFSLPFLSQDFFQMRCIECCFVCVDSYM